MILKDSKYMKVPFFKTKMSFLDFLTEDEANLLDDEYYYGHSYYKQLSIMYENMSEATSEEEALSKIWDIAIVRFGDKWVSLYNNMIATDYDVFNPYVTKEKENVGTKVTTSTDTGSDVYGFNSEGAVSVSDTHGKTQSVSDKVDNERESMRTGNNGNKTFAELIEGEINYRERWNIYQIIFNDIDELLCSRYIR